MELFCCEINRCRRRSAKGGLGILAPGKASALESALRGDLQISFPGSSQGFMVIDQWLCTNSVYNHRVTGLVPFRQFIHIYIYIYIYKYIYIYININKMQPTNPNAVT